MDVVSIISIQLRKEYVGIRNPTKLRPKEHKVKFLHALRHAFSASLIYWREMVTKSSKLQRDMPLFTFFEGHVTLTMQTVIKMAALVYSKSELNFDFMVLLKFSIKLQACNFGKRFSGHDLQL